MREPQPMKDAERQQVNVMENIVLLIMGFCVFDEYDAGVGGKVGGEKVGKWEGERGI